MSFPSHGQGPPLPHRHPPPSVAALGPSLASSDPSDFLNALKRHPHIPGSDFAHAHASDPLRGSTGGRAQRMPVAGVDGCWICDPEGCGNVNYPRRSSCHLCGKPRSAVGTRIVKEYVESLINYGNVVGGGVGSTANYFNLSGKDLLSLPAADKALPRSGSSAYGACSVVPTSGTRAEIINMKFKTKLCKSWIEGGSCVRGEQCDFAHGMKELRKIGENAAGTGAAACDHLRLRFDLNAVVNAVINQVGYSSNNACVEPQCDAFGVMATVKVALYGHWAIEFAQCHVRLLENGVSSAMSKAARNAVLEAMGSSIRVSGHPSRWMIVDLNEKPILHKREGKGDMSYWYPLLGSLPWNTVSHSHHVPMYQQEVTAGTPMNAAYNSPSMRMRGPVPNSMPISHPIMMQVRGSSNNVIRMQSQVHPHQMPNIINIQHQFQPSALDLHDDTNCFPPPGSMKRMYTPKYKYDAGQQQGMWDGRFPYANEGYGNEGDLPVPPSTANSQVHDNDGHFVRQRRGGGLPRSSHADPEPSMPSDRYLAFLENDLAELTISIPDSVIHEGSRLHEEKGVSFNLEFLDSPSVLASSKRIDTTENPKATTKFSSPAA